MAKKKKEPYIPKNGILGNATDYNYYKMNAITKITCFLVGLVVGFGVGYIFYESIILSLIAGCIVGAICIPIYHKSYLDKRKKNLTLQFRDMLESLSASIGAGSNIQDAFQAAYQDMVVQYTEDGYIAKEIAIIMSGLQNNIAIENLLMDFGQRSGIEDIMSFADVFETCYRKGGNIKEVIMSTYHIISDKIEVQLEIKTMVSSKTSEQNLMLVMPVVLVLMLKTMAGDMIDLNSPTGRMSTTVAMVIFAVSYLMSKKILDIKV